MLTERYAEPRADIMHGWTAVWGKFVDPEDWNYQTLSAFSEVTLHALQAGSSKQQVAFGSFFKEVSLDPATEYSFNIPEIKSAYRLYVNGRLVVRRGVVSATTRQEATEMRPIKIDLPRGLDRAKLLFHISSYDMKLLGPMTTMQLASSDEITEFISSARLRDVFALSAIVVMAFYHAALF